MSVADALPLSPPATSSGSRKRTLPLFALKPTTGTPDDSPASGPESSSLGSKKKVEFSPWADIHHPSASVTSSLDASSVKPLPPSRECQSYIKSILKSSIQDDRPMAGFDGPTNEKKSLNESMESIVQQLARNDNAVSIDAYQILASTIKAYDEIPEQAVFKNKLNVITRHIRQHLGALERQDPEPTDTNLVTSALKVLVILVWSPEYASLLGDDFRSFILDRAVSVIAEHTTPKSVLIHYLHVLATQDFRPGLLTSNSRASRLVEALKGLTEHVKGNGVVSERLLVYQRLLDQARPVMKSKSTSWVEHMLSAMASNVADTRNKALALGRKACQAFPASSSISGSVRLALDLKQESGRTLGTIICRRLEKMVVSKDEALQVPQIWAVVLLLCNNSSMRIDTWQGLREWLMVIQRCFNGSDAYLRLQANIAWNRFVYIARPHEASESLVSMLSKPVAAQLDRTASDKSSKASHAVAMSSYCNLLYYAFRPATSTSQYNRVWNEYIVKVMRSPFFEKSSGNADIASRIFMSLFWDAKTDTKVWNENRAHENRLVDPEEIPTIDCKWTRSRCSPVLEIFQVLFRYSSWGFSTSSDQAYVSKAWRHFLKAIREAGSKEIKMSIDTRAAIITILRFLTQLWRSAAGQLSKSDHESVHLSKEILTQLSHTAIAELGIGRVLDLMEAEPVAFSPSLFTVIFEMLKLELRSGTKSQAEFARFFSIMNNSLEVRYNAAADTHYAENCAFFETVFKVLSSMPITFVEYGLETLSPGLAVWLRDEDGCLSPEEGPGLEQFSRRVVAVLKQFVDAFTNALSSVSPRCVPALDACLAAAFASSHSMVVSAVTHVWNKKFGGSDEVKIGPQLTGAINHLLPDVELLLPATWKENEAEHSSMLAPAYQTQVGSVPKLVDRPQKNNPVAEGAEETTITEAKTINGDCVDQDESYQTAPVAEAASTSKRRHDDSQINFVAIHSSPPSSVPEESQFLTNRQKEVRDRQREEPAVTFADLRSTPRPQSRHGEPRDCGFARRAATMTEKPATPTLPEHNDAIDAEPEPSPTPKSRLLREVAEVDVPSSPPSIPGTADRQDVDMENVSSPMPDAVEAEDRHVEFGSPLTHSEIRRLPEESEEVANDLQAPNEEIQSPDSQVPESVEASHNPPRIDPTDQQLGESPADPVAMVVQEPAETSLHDSVEVAENTVPTSSPPRQAVKAVATPPHRSSSVFNTDELNELSASQLSKDLDWSAVLEGLDTPETVCKSLLPVNEQKTAPQAVNGTVLPTEEEGLASHEIAEPENSVAEPEPVTSKAIQKKRKRPQSGYAERKRRRKSARSHSQSSSSQGSYFEREDEELLDCIVVDTSSEYLGSSSPLRPTEVRQDQYITSQSASQGGDDESLRIIGGLKRGGRPRKLSQPQVKQEQIDDELHPNESAQEVSSSQQRPTSRRRSRHRLSLEASVEPESHPAIPVVQITAATSDAAPGLTEDERQPSTTIHLVTSQTPESLHAPHSDVVANLQAVLDQIKTAAPRSVDLRTVDELCFQIRFQAQLAVMGSNN